jgi:hypothetical protein
VPRDFSCLAIKAANIKQITGSKPLMLSFRFIADYVGTVCRERDSEHQTLLP